MTNDELLAELLAKPVGKAVAPREGKPEDFTSSVEVNGFTATATINAPEGTVNEGTALQYLEEENLDPSEWEVTHFKKIKYGQGMESVKFSFKRVSQTPATGSLSVEEMVAWAEAYSEEPEGYSGNGEYGFAIFLGDTQWGKIDGDGAKGTLARAMTGIDEAMERLLEWSHLFTFGHVHIGWMGDHVEGFTSQGGANVWRTNLTMNEQIRLTRRVMLHALCTFGPEVQRLTMAAVPGNHGEPVRFMGTGTTRYDDSHDTESLIAISDMAKMMPERFGHCEFFVPDTDELIVTVDVANTTIAHHHGHKWGPGKHFDWWADQAFNRDSPMHMADVLVAGHLHHEKYEREGNRTFWQIPSLESDSTWYRHKKGSGGSPGLCVAVVKDGRVIVRETIDL